MPIWSMLKSLKVAFPVGSVFCVSVPLKTPLPLFSERVIGTPLFANGFPTELSICTTTGAKTAPASLPPTGPVVNASLLRPPTVRLKEVEV
jgi:hypothetical protein